MEDLTIPGWAVLALGAVILPWMIWLTKQVNANGKDIAINTANDKHVADELTKIHTAISTSNVESKANFNKLEAKFDMFLNQEMTLLKQVAAR